MFFTKDAQLTYANNATLVGRDNIVDFFNQVFPLLQSMGHFTRSFSTVPDKNQLYLRDFITYVVKGDPEAKEIKIPAFDVFDLVDDTRERMMKVDLEEGRKEIAEEAAVVKRVEIYLDASEVFGRIQGVKEGAL